MPVRMPLIAERIGSFLFTYSSTPIFEIFDLRILTVSSGIPIFSSLFDLKIAKHLNLTNFALSYRFGYGLFWKLFSEITRNWSNFLNIKAAPNGHAHELLLFGASRGGVKLTVASAEMTFSMCGGSIIVFCAQLEVFHNK